jgi:PAS domain S-box-containing protein
MTPRSSTPLVAPEFLVSVVEHSDDAIITKDLNGCVTSWNKSAERIFGYTAEEMIGKPISIIAAPDRIDEMPAILSRIRKGERVDHYQTVRKTKDGRLIDISLTVSPVRDAGGRIIGASKIARDISEQVRAAERLNAALQKSEAEARRNRDWLETTTQLLERIACFVRNLEDKIVYWNPGAADLYGFSEREALGAVSHSLLQTEFPAPLAEIRAQVTNAGVWHGELVHTRRDGSRIAVASYWVLHRDMGGKPVTILEVNVDITQGKEAERELVRLKDQLAEERASVRGLHELGPRLMAAGDFRLLLNEILSAALVATGAEMGNIQLLDSAGVLRIEAQKGFSQEFLDFFNRVTKDEAATCGAALAGRERVVVEDVQASPIFAGTPALKVLLNAGVRTVQSTPMISHSGVLVGMLSTHYKQPKRPSDRDLRLMDLLARQAADLIGKIRAEAELRATQQQLVSITDNMAAAVTRCSRDYRYVWVSPAYAAWLGLPKEQIAGRYIRDVIGSEGFEEIRPYMERVLSGETVNYTARVHYRSRGARWIQAVYIPARSEDGAEAWTAVVSDITESKQREAQLLRANADLARANEDLSQFAFAASHDLQEPLRAIGIYSQLLVSSYRGDLAGDAEKYLRFIVEGTKRMRELLSDLLDYTQLTPDGGETQAAAEIDLNRVFEEVLENCKTTINETKAIVTADRLPTVLGHESYFIELFQNLISNALKYRSDRPPRVQVSAENQDGQWLFRVADNGVGIDPEFYSYIFGVFKRLHGKEVQGTGIGLAICKRVVERHGGRIWVKSVPGQGATFYFTLPAVNRAAAHE